MRPDNKAVGAGTDQEKPGPMKMLCTGKGQGPDHRVLWRESRKPCVQAGGAKEKGGEGGRVTPSGTLGVTGRNRDL